MDKKVFLAALKAGPIEVHMNDGSSHVIRSTEFAIVDDVAVHALPESQHGETMRAIILSLVCMNSILNIEIR